MQTFVALLLAYILSIFFRSFLSVLADRIMVDMQIGATELAAMSSAWFIVFALMQFPVGWALDFYGPRRTVLPLMAVGGIGVALFPFAQGALTGGIAMGLIGIGCSSVYMAGVFVFARNHSMRHFGLLSSLFVGFGSVGNLAGTTPLAWLADAVGWRETMMMLGAAYALAFVMAAIFLRDPPRIARRQGANLFDGIGEVLRMPVFWLFIPVVFFSYAIMVTLRGLWVAPYLGQVTGLSAIAQSEAALLMALAMSVSAFLFGWIESRWSIAKWLSVGSNVAIIGLLLWLAVTRQPSAGSATLAFTALGFCGFTYAILMAHIRPFLRDDLVGRGMTLTNFIFIAGSAAVQTGSGWIIDAAKARGADPAGAFALMFAVLAACLAVSTLVYLMTPARPAPKAA